MRQKILKICGKIATQPVVTHLMNELVAMILVETENGYKKFACKTSAVIIDNPIETQLPRSMFSDVALSGIGDDVVLYVFADPLGQPTPSIQNFINNTRKLGRFY